MTEWRKVLDEPPPIGECIELSRDGQAWLETIRWTKNLAAIAEKSGLRWRFVPREETTND